MSTDLLREIHGDIKVIKVQVASLVENATKVDTRILPMEEDFIFRKKLYKLMISGAGLIAVLMSAITFYKKNY